MFESNSSTSTIDSAVDNGFEEIPHSIVKTISTLLIQLIRKNKNPENYVEDAFLSSIIPSMSIEDYLKRIIHYSQIQLPTLLSAIIYIAHIVKKKNYCLCFNNVYRILITSCFMSSKFNEDTCYSSLFYSKVGGISKKNLDSMESEFFALNDYSLFIKESVYDKYYIFFAKEVKSTFEKH